MPIAVASAAGETKRFLQDNLTNPAQAATMSGAIAAIDHIVALPEFPTLSASLKDTLRDIAKGP